MVYKYHRKILLKLRCIQKLGYITSKIYWLRKVVLDILLNFEHFVFFLIDGYKNFNDAIFPKNTIHIRSYGNRYLARL